MGQTTGGRPLTSSPRDATGPLRSAASATHRLPAGTPTDSARPGARFAELAGGKAAECAVICCCCPCGLAGLLLLAVVRLPAGLCHRALRKRILLRRSKKKKAKLLGPGSGWKTGSSSGSESDGGSGWSFSKVGSVSDDEFADFDGLRGGVAMATGGSWPVRSPSAELFQLEKDVWSKFCNSGFWRSPSQREDLEAVNHDANLKANSCCA